MENKLQKLGWTGGKINPEVGYNFVFKLMQKPEGLYEISKTPIAKVIARALEAVGGSTHGEGIIKIICPGISVRITVSPISNDFGLLFI